MFDIRCEDKKNIKNPCPGSKITLIVALPSVFRFPLISIESSACNMSDYVLERLGGGGEEEEIVSPASRARLAAPDYICSSHPEHLNL